MKIFITTAIWGTKYVDIFLQYSLASLLSKNNIAQLSYLQEIGKVDNKMRFSL